MSIGSSDPTDPRFELVQLRERLRYTEEQVRQLEEDIKQARNALERKDIEIRRISAEREDYRVNLAAASKDVEHQEELLKLALEKKEVSGRRSKSLNVSGNLSIFFAGVLAAFGANLLTAATPNSLGWLFIVGALLLAIGGIYALVAKGGE
jgi:hypothetical protein